MVVSTNGIAKLVVSAFLLLFAMASQNASAQFDDFSKATGFYQSGQYSKCTKYIDLAIADGIFGERWRVLRLKSLLAAGEYQEAYKSLAQYLAEFDTSVQIRWVGVEVARNNNDLELAQRLINDIEDNARRDWRYKDSINQATLAAFELSRGVDPKKVIDARLTPYQNIDVSTHLVFGNLGINKGDYSIAAKQFLLAQKLSPKDPDVLFGLAQAYAGSDAEKATGYLNAALEVNKNHFPSNLYLAEQKISEEDYEVATEILEKLLKINSVHARTLALRAVVAHLMNKPAEEKKFRTAALSTWKSNPEVDHLIGKKLSQKYRFAEGEQYQRRALVYDKNYTPAKIQLAQDLLRLGKDDEGWQLAEQVYESDGYSILAYNLVQLRSNIREFKTLKADGFIVRMSPSEMEIYGEQVLALLQKAKAHLCRKYEFEISKPIVVEIFPKQQDFAIRTFGLPGGAGYLGVCFGKVITMNSPGSQGAAPTNWNSVLWHEFCHVVTLQKSKNKMPRWLSEGISVYEERLKDPSWGQSMNADFKQMILGKDLTPVSKLSGAFLQPKSAMHLQFAYYESSLVVQFLVEKHGLETINRVLVDLGLGMTINEALDRYTGSIELLDKEFAEYAKKLASDFAPQADFTKIDPSKLGNIGAVDEYLKQSPNNIPLLVQASQLQIKAEQFKQARTNVEQILKLDAGNVAALSMRAQIARAQNDPKLEKEILTKLVSVYSDGYAARFRLAQLAKAAEDWPAVIKQARECTAINPLVPEPHRLLSEAGQKSNRHEIVVSALRAQLQLNPIDPAKTHFDYAIALRSVGDRTLARRHVLMALEQAPRFRQAHQLLLELNGDSSASGKAGGDQPATNRQRKSDRKK